MNRASWNSVELAPRVGLCLAGSLVWVAPHYWGSGATHARGNESACVVLLAGAVVTLLLAALCWAGERPGRIGGRGLLASGTLVVLALALVGPSVSPSSGHSPRNALALGAVSWGVFAALRLSEAHLAGAGSSRRRWLLLGGGLGFVPALAVLAVFQQERDCANALLHPAASSGGWLDPRTVRDLFLGVSLSLLSIRLPVPRIPRNVAYGLYLLVVGLQGEAIRRLNSDPSLVETLRSAPLVAGVLGLVVS